MLLRRGCARSRRPEPFYSRHATRASDLSELIRAHLARPLDRRILDTVSRRGWITLLVALGALVVTTVAITASGDEPAARAATPPSTTTTVAPTTTTAPALDPLTTEVATAHVPTLAVAAALPSDVATSPAAVNLARQLHTTFAAYSPERAKAPEIPTVRSPVEGRRRTSTGWEFDNPTPWGDPLVLVVTEHEGDWLRVQIPARPNGTEGWVRAGDVTVSSHHFRVEIAVGARMLRAFDGATQIAVTKVVVGKASTPTPTGRFFVTDFEKKRRGTAYGPWILPLSAYSQALDSFSGGVPVVAMHGTNHPELIGSPASNGCIRMPDDVIDLLHRTLPLGTPVDITA